MSLVNWNVLDGYKAAWLSEVYEKHNDGEIYTGGPAGDAYLGALNNEKRKVLLALQSLKDDLEEYEKDLDAVKKHQEYQSAISDKGQNVKLKLIRDELKEYAQVKESDEWDKKITSAMDYIAAVKRFYASYTFVLESWIYNLEHKIKEIEAKIVDRTNDLNEINRRIIEVQTTR